MARPTKYNETIAHDVCQRIATSSDGLRKICRELRLTQGRVYEWLRDHDEFREQYARARDLQAQVLFDEMLEIADTPKPGVIVKQSGGKTEKIHQDMWNHRRLQIDARKWVLSKLMPKKYGERTEIEHSGSGSGGFTIGGAKSLAELVAKVQSAEDLTDDQLAAIIAGEKR